MSIKLERLSHILVEEIGKVLQNEVKDKELKFVTITDVKIASDLSHAKVYFTLLDENKKEEVSNSLKKASGFIRTKLCNSVEIRKMPELHFMYDESINYATKIENIIDKLKEDNNEK